MILFFNLNFVKICKRAKICVIGRIMRHIFLKSGEWSGQIWRLPLKATGVWCNKFENQWQCWVETHYSELCWAVSFVAYFCELALKMLSKNIKSGCDEGRYLTVKSAYLLNLLNKDETSRFLHKRELYVETEERDKMKQT